MLRVLSRCLSVVFCGIQACGNLFAADAPQVTFKPTEDGLAVLIGSEEFTVLRTKADLPKPYFSPVRSAGGTIITRPINDPDDKDHPHHKGIWLAVDEVNEVKFWAEQGKILNKTLASTPATAAGPAKLTLTNHWLVADGQPVLIAAGDVDSLGLDLIEEGEAAEAELVADVAAPTAALDDAGAQFEIAVPDYTQELGQPQELGWDAGDDAATDDWNGAVNQDTDDISAVDDDSFDSDEIGRASCRERVCMLV